MLHLFMVFMLSHLLADFVFQRDAISRGKRGKIACKKNEKYTIKIIALLFHVFIHLLTMMLLFFIISKLDSNDIPMNSVVYLSSVIILVSHFIVEYLKDRIGKNEFTTFLVV